MKNEKDYEEIRVLMEHNLDGCRDDERKWAEKALVEVYNCYARFANNGGIHLYNSWWDALHPNCGKLEGELLKEYDEGFERYMRIFANIAARTHGISKDRKRIVKLKNCLDSVCVSLSTDLKTGSFNGVVEDYKWWKW